jgi:hypothetical protein
MPTTAIRRASCAALLAAAACLLPGLTDAGGLKKELGGPKKSYVKLSASAGKPDDDGRQVVTVTMEIEKPWYAYANPVDNEELAAGQTHVRIAGPKGKLEEVKVVYPPGKEKKLGKDTFKVYEGKVSIVSQVRRARGDTGPLEVTVEYMTCNPEGQCLPPEKVKLKVE